MAEILTVGDIENYLEHHGVRGMKWGHHSANTSGGSSGGGSGHIGNAKKEVKQELHNWNESRIAKGQQLMGPKGKGSHAALRIAGQHIAGKVLVIASHMAINALPMNPATKRGLHSVGRLASTAVDLRTINNSVKVGQAINRNKKSGN